MADDSPGFFRSLRSYATEYIQTKRKNLQAKPQTQVGSAGGLGQYEFGGQEIDQQELKDVKAMRESGGIISQVYHSKALIKFGTGAELQAEDDDLQQALNEELFEDLSSLILDVGEDAIWYPYSVGEVVETRTGDFSHIELIEPWTMLPQTDEFGDIIAWEQHISGHTAETFDPEEIGHVLINKSSGRDKTGISEVLRSKEEIETFKSNQNAMREATERLGYPFIHAKAGREGATQLNDNELRRIRNRLAEIGPGETQVTGPDVDIEQMEPATVDFGAIQSRDMKMLATASGLPIELLNEGSDGLGSGMPAELRKELLALRNEADRRKVADQFVSEFVKPVVREYTEYDHTQDITMQIDPFLDSKEDMASLIQSVGGYLTANEVRDKLGMAPIDDEELGESYVTPEDEESDDPAGDGPLFGSDEGDTDFRLADVPDKYTEDTGLTEDDFVPNESILDVIEPTLAFIDEHGLPNPDDQREGASRINQLKDHIDNNEPLAPAFWQEIANFHARHRAQGNDECDESSLPDKADEVDFDPCHFDNGWFSDRTWGGDPAKEQAERIVDAIESTEGVELSDGHDCGGLDLADTEGLQEWERVMLDLHDGVIAADADKNLTELTETALPQFVKNRLRDAIFGDAVFSQFDSMADSDRMQLQEFLAEELTDNDGWTTDSVAGRLRDLDPALDRDDAERIARTETQSIVNTAREEGYQEQDLEGDGFYWVGSVDDRTTDACKWLIGGTDTADNIGGAFDGTNPNHGGEPVPLEELKELVTKAAEKDPEVQTKPRDWTPHINCRKSYVRDV
jgi:hypothetical protein